MYRQSSKALFALGLSKEPARILVNDSQAEKCRADAHAGLQSTMNTG